MTVKGRLVPTWERLPEARRSAVIAAAENEFAKNGFSRGSLNVIAREAGVAKGSLFQYFDDKVDLFCFLSDSASLRIRSAMESVIAALAWESDFFTALEDLLMAWDDYFSSHPHELAMTVSINLEPDLSARAAVLQVVNHHIIDVMEPLLREAFRRGALRADADVDAFLAMLLVLLPYVALAPSSPTLDPVLGLGDPDRGERRLAVDRLVAVFRAAFGSGPQTNTLIGH